jgi:quercetin dioxygenase-like cupin family protein
MTVPAANRESSTLAVAPYLYQPGESELRWMGDVRSHFLATGDTTGGAFALVDERASKGEAVPLHRHAADMESFYVLEGELTLFIDGNSGVKAGPGAFAHLPAGTIHGFRVESDWARYLLLTTPNHGEFYRAITLASGPGGQRPEGKVTGEVIQSACRTYGIEFVGMLPD